MSRTGLILKVVAGVIVLAAVGVLTLWPNTYEKGEGLTVAVAFWRDEEAFLFLTTVTNARASNPIHQKLESVLPQFALAFVEPGAAVFGGRAYRLTPGRIEAFPLPEPHVPWGTWSLDDGKLRLTPLVTQNEAPGFRWDGSRFVPVPAPTPPPAAVDRSEAPEPTELTDDLAAPDPEPGDEGEEEEAFGLASQSVREEFRRAGWHSKTVSGYQKEGGAVLPIALAGTTFRLTVRSFPMPKEFTATTDMLSLGMKSLELEGESLTPPSRMLWEQAGWKEITKAEYQALVKASGREFKLPLSFRVWPWVIAGVALLQIAKPAVLLFALGTAKSKVLKGMATSYSFPPATPAQFPLLDVATFERLAREAESLGFEPVLDFSLVPDVPGPSSFCRLLVHRRHHCFAEVSQIFPPGQRPLPASCSIQSYLQDGWSIGTSNQKPMAAASLVRRPRALGALIPGAPVAQLLEALLKLRGEVCQDLGLAPLIDDTLESYIAHTQRGLQEMRAVLASRSLAVGLSRAAVHKLSLLVKTKPEYLWLGDYPKEVERRRQPIRPT